MTDADRRAVLGTLYDLARMIADGYSDKQITKELGMSRKTLHLRQEAIAYLCDVDRSRNVRIQIGRWWESHDTEYRKAA